MTALLVKLEPGIYEYGDRFRVERVGTTRRCIWLLLERRRGQWEAIDSCDTLYEMRSLLGDLIRRRRESCSATPPDRAGSSSRRRRSAPPR
jgi:hypothetical protein